MIAGHSARPGETIERTYEPEIGVVNCKHDSAYV